mmetsp:Transcript_14077/g.40524  ORF Transcript_14077/g.40524 Transcript_14077/m.40524 type:complete len:226 (+) Transcript_14077:423-1100(+)
MKVIGMFEAVMIQPGANDIAHCQAASTQKSGHQFPCTQNVIRKLNPEVAFGSQRGLVYDWRPIFIQQLQAQRIQWECTKDLVEVLAVPGVAQDNFGCAASMHSQPVRAQCCHRQVATERRHVDYADPATKMPGTFQYGDDLDEETRQDSAQELRRQCARGVQLVSKIKVAATLTHVAVHVKILVPIANLVATSAILIRLLPRIATPALNRLWRRDLPGSALPAHA